MASPQDQPTVGQVKAAIRRFYDFANDLIKSDMNTFGDRLKLLIDFCEKDDVFKSLHKQLMENPKVDVEAWVKKYDEAGYARKHGLQFPTNLDDRISLMYQLLVAGVGNPNALIGKLPMWFVVSGNKINTYIAAFSETVMIPLFREIGYRLDDIENKLPVERNEVVGSSILQIIHNTGSLVQQIAQGKDIQQNADLSADQIQLKELFDQLRQAVKQSSLSTKEKHDSEEIISTAQAEASSPSPKQSVVKALLAGISATAGAAKIIESIIALLHHLH